MKLSEIIVESQNLEEGPIANKIGNVVGNAAGTVAKGIGAVAGGVAGTWDAMKKGFKAGKSTVAQGGDEPADAAEPAAGATDTTAPAAGSTAPAATLGAATGQPTGQPTGAPTQSRPAKSNTPFGRLSQAAAGSEEPAATPAATGQPTTPAAAPATTGTDMPTKPFQVPGAGTNPNPTATGKPASPEAPAASSETPQAPSAANDSAYAKAQKAISGLQPDQQKELMSVLMSDPKVKAALTAKPAAPAAAPEAPTGEPAAPTTPPAAPAATPAPTGEPAAKKKGGRKAKPAAPSQAELDADRERIMGITSDSVIRKGNLVAEDAAVIKDLETFKRGFERGAADPFGMAKSSPAAATKLNDPTGMVPQDIMSKVVSLDSAQRTQLYTLLRGKRI